MHIYDTIPLSSPAIISLKNLIKKRGCTGAAAIENSGRGGSKTFLRRLFGVGSSLEEEKEEAGLGCFIESY
ncbi:hypothetical protein M422DRAFT_33139 [Sphaerobolus stellatus SS14]|uniref:Uncharacterized protein n=1 Tax=Sphaerobolus stellatus (strain SS14) TaxID=990650 RepID=A0A0C9UV57_SPHS4|nr:hypothetical protein M422DRAFT_33139 [Sphaerobolus stellatus SS14]